MIEGEKIVATFDVHRFRGLYIDQFSHVEEQLCRLIRALQKSDTSIKMPSLVGQKLALVREKAKDAKHWKDPAAAQQLLADLEPHLILRNELAHAIVQVTVLGTVPLVTWRLPQDDLTIAGNDRRALNANELKCRLSALRKLAKKLRDQDKTRSAPNPASSPPQPSPDATSGL